MLESYLRERLAQRPLLLMTHIVIGYPSLEASLEIVDEMVAAGVDLIELQVPFSEPIADGKVILAANQAALAAGVKVDDCFEFARRVIQKHPIPFLFMGYYNLLCARTPERFIRDMSRVGLRGAIVPDLPPEEGAEYLELARQYGVDPVFIFSPNTPDQRMRHLAKCSRGFVYVVARTGVTGQHTEFSDELSHYLTRARAATSLPLALGFGLKTAADLEFARGRVDIAVVGSETLRVVQSRGVQGVRPFLQALRPVA